MNIGVDQISVFHGGRGLFREVSFQVSPEDKIGLIGKNGAGKSTLLKLLAGLQEADEGTVSRSKELTIGYLPQEMSLPEGKSVFQEASTAFSGLIAQNEELNKINSLLLERSDYNSDSYLNLIHQQTDLTESLNRNGWFEISKKVEKILLGLGFNESEFTKSTAEFSGGWRMRIELAKILLKNPTLLLLDEPTNHLDIESIQWLERFLSTVTVSIVLISHDITFLNKITNRTIEINNGKIYDFPLSYSGYLIRKKEIKETLIAGQKNQQKKIKETEDFINRFRAKNTKAKQVQSRIKMLDRMDIVEIDEEDNSSIRIRFPEAVRSGKISIEVNNVSKSYEDKVVLNDVNFLIGRGEKIAFIGKNGAGKTTMSKIIVGETKSTGDIKLGHLVKIGYYAQDQSDTMDGNLDVISVVQNESKNIKEFELRNLLGAFLFSGEDQYKKVKILSGGEKARLALCKLLLTPVNFLVLDEPTNHLDIQSKSILKKALIEFDGTLIIVSHDREFLRGLTNKIFHFSDSKVKEFIGDIDEFLESKKLSQLDDLQVKPQSPVNPDQGKVKNIKNDFQERKDFQKNEKRLKSRIAKLEDEIEELENQLKEINKNIGQSSGYEAELINNYQSVNQKLDRVMKSWENECAELEKLDAKK